MDKLLKELLLANQYRVYSLIVSTYYQDIIELKPTLFRLWFCSRIDIPVESVNIGSLKSALVRERKKVNSKKFIVKSLNLSPNTEVDNFQDNDFKFSNPDTPLPATKRIIGY